MPGQKFYPSIGIHVPQVLLPRPEIDPARWAVVACDQYTSELEYWRKVETLAAGQPSTYNLILPEVYLGKPDEPERIQRIQAAMQDYLQRGLLEPFSGLVYVERTVDHKTRRGLMLCLDLEMYDYNKGAQTLIRATEGTIIERLPPRMKIRQGALLELPHILVLIDDPQRTVIEPFAHAKDRLAKRYDFDLMMDSGHLAGYAVTDEDLELQAVQALYHLADAGAFAKKYNVAPGTAPILFAIGDGNHSLATAKAIWEQNKHRVGMDHPSRYALVEIENVHDEGLEFEPIHRVLFGVQGNIVAALQQMGANLSFEACNNPQEMIQTVLHGDASRQSIGVVQGAQSGILKINDPTSNLAVGKLQPLVDKLLKAGTAAKIDYLHGEDILLKLAGESGNAGFFLPKMDKSDLFKTVIVDGALPRKTFSMGEAREKRFYMESRQIA